MTLPEPLPSYTDVVQGTAPWCLEAGRVYHGKTAGEIYDFFFSGGGTFLDIESLAWVGPRAFAYYIQPVIRYCLTLGQVHHPEDGETTDPDSLSTVAGIIQTGLEREPAALVPCAVELADFCRQVHSDYDRFDTDPAVYGGLQDRFSALEAGLRHLGARPDGRDMA